MSCPLSTRSSPIQNRAVAKLVVVYRLTEPKVMSFSAPEAFPTSSGGASSDIV